MLKGIPFFRSYATKQSPLRRFTPVLCLALFLVVSFPVAAAEDDAQSILKLYAAGQIEQADIALDEFLSKHPDSGHKCELLLASAQAPVSISEAQKRLHRTIDQCRGCDQRPQAMARLAMLLHLSGQNSAAYGACRDFIEQYEDHELTPEVLLLQGALEMRYRGGSQAGNAYATFLAKFPGHPKAVVALVGVADAKIKRGDWSGAHQAYLRALAANPTDLDLPKIYFHLGWSAEEMGQADRARHYYRELLRLFADSAYAERAKSRLKTALDQSENRLPTPVRAPAVRYAAKIGIFPDMKQAELQARPFIENGYKVHYILRGRNCELLVGEFDTEFAAQLFVQEINKRFHVRAVPQRLP